jgi:3-phosphoshikimate 1-carboxyvinyltransferase
MLESLGGLGISDHNTMTIYPRKFRGGTVETHGDHRIAMAAAIAATNCENDVVILNAECVSKSYPRFWEDYAALGGNYEQYIW